MHANFDTSRYRVEPGTAVRLTECETTCADPVLQDLKDDELKEAAQRFVADCIEDFSAAQELLYADNRYSVLLLFQGMDAAGKDSTIKHVLSGVNPAGFQVVSFNRPSREELDHNFLWRYWRAMPERGRIGIFNRSYYEDVTTVRVHPERGNLGFSAHPIDSTFWNERFEDINALEKHLWRNGTIILKFFLNLSWSEQRNRLIRRLEKPEKHWKYDPSDLFERNYWTAYVEAFEAMLAATSTSWATWHVIPADHKWVMRALVASIIATRLDEMELSFPQPDEAKARDMRKALKELKDEPDQAPPAEDEKTASGGKKRKTSG